MPAASLREAAMNPEPEVRDDGRCALETCRKPIKPPKRRREVPASLYVDPFCSTDCAKAYFGVRVTSYSESQGLGSPKGRRPAAAA